MPRYTRPMRTLLAVAVVLGVAGGCGMEQKSHMDEADKAFSAGRLDGKFGHNDPILMMLSPEERGALEDAGLMASDGIEPIGDDLDGGAPPEEVKSGSEKAGDVMMSILTVGVTVGMMVAPYLLF